MKGLWNRIKNIVKVARLVSYDDSGNFSRGVASYMGKEVPLMDMKSYGHASRPPANSMCLVFAQNGQESNAIAIIDDPKRRTLKGLKEGESGLYNQLTGDYIYLKEDSNVEIKTAKVTLLVGDTTVTIEDGQVTIDAADTTMNGNLQVNGTINATDDINTEADMNADGEVTADAGGAGVTLTGHVHLGTGTLANSGGPVGGSTAAPTPGT